MNKITHKSKSIDRGPKAFSICPVDMAKLNDILIDLFPPFKRGQYKHYTSVRSWKTEQYTERHFTLEVRLDACS